MANEWFYSHDGARHGPVAVEKIKEMAAAGQLRRDDLVWQAGMADWVAAGSVPGLLPPASVPPPVPPAAGPPPLSPGSSFSASPGMADIQNKKLVAGLCGIFLGAFGVHKFVLGMTTPGLIMLAVTLVSTIGGCACFVILPFISFAGSAVMGIFGLVEGIIYLSKSDEEFYQTYIVGKKEWF